MKLKLSILPILLTVLLATPLISSCRAPGPGGEEEEVEQSGEEEGEEEEGEEEGEEEEGEEEGE